MSQEEAALELKEAPEPPRQDAPSPAPAPAPAAEADATEADVSEADLDLDPDQDPDQDQEALEKVPMTAAEERAAGEPAAGEGPEKNGAVKLKVPEEEEAEEVHFTGLNKEELLRVASSPGWVRTRWTLLVLFWLAWLGMLAGAVLIILKAPSCKQLPSQSWWNEAPLYRVRSIRDFTESQDIKGVEQKLDVLSELKVRGLVLGPVHVAPKDDPMALAFEEVSGEMGNLDQFRSLLQTAHKRGLYVVLNLTPNYLGSTGPWFSNDSVSDVAERLKSALVFWLTLGVDGVQLDSVDTVSSLVQWSDIRAIVQNWTDSRPHKRLLLGTSSLSSPSEFRTVLGDSGVDLLLAPVLRSQTDPTERAQTAQLLSQNQENLLWSLDPGATPGATPEGPGEDCALGKMDLLLLLTLPGNALINSGDELGLRATQGEKFPRMQWDSEQDLNDTQQGSRSDRASCRVFLSSVSSLRAKERSLLFGDFSVVQNSSSVLVYLRSWDQSPRFLVLFNYSPDRALSLDPRSPEGGAAALEALGGPGARGKVVLSSNNTALSPDSELDLREVRLGPRQAALLQLSHG